MGSRGTVRSVRVLLLGYGRVNQAFAWLAATKSDLLARDYRLALRLVAIKRSRFAALAASPGNDRAMNWEEAIALSEDGCSVASDIGWSSRASFTEVLAETQPDLVVQATPSDLQTAEPAKGEILAALQAGAHVVTATKGPLALAFGELREAADYASRELRYSAATAAALPTIDIPKSVLRGAEITKVQGLLNGTTTYVLSRMQATGCSMRAALGEAQRAGIAESDPSLDMEGYDTAAKLVIITNSLYAGSASAFVPLADVRVQGISDITSEDMLAARERESVVRLVGTARWGEGLPELSVAPEQLPEGHPLAGVSGKEKGAVYETDTMGRIAVTGGASSPVGAAAALLRDTIATFADGDVRTFRGNRAML